MADILLNAISRFYKNEDPKFPLLHRKDILHKITLIVCLMQTIGNYSFDGRSHISH